MVPKRTLPKDACSADEKLKERLENYKSKLKQNWRKLESKTQNQAKTHLHLAGSSRSNQTERNQDANGETQPTNTKTTVNPNRLNTGIPTGTRNNLLVVDLDVKDDGVQEFEKYVAEHGEPNTLKVKTPTKGSHYYFNYSHADADCQHMIKSHLRNSTKI